MNTQLPLFPESASSVAAEVDALFYVWSAISVFFTALIAGLIIYFLVQYRRRPGGAPEVVALFCVWSAISVFFTALIAGLIIYFMVKYRRRSEDEVGLPERAPVWLEIAWSAIPLAIAAAVV